MTYAKDDVGDPAKDTLVCEFPLNDMTPGSYCASLWIADSAYGEFRPVMGKYTTFQVTHADVSEVHVSAKYGSENTEIADGEKVLLSELADADNNVSPITFTAKLTPERVSYPSIAWKVENMDKTVTAPIAEITQDRDDPFLAQLSFTGKAYGKVTVTATASSKAVGGTVTTPVSQSFTFETERDISLFSGLGSTMKAGEGTTVRWLNSDGDVYNESAYTVKLYRADASGSPAGSQLGEDYTVPDGGNTLEIPAGILTETSKFENGGYLPVYVAVVTTPDLYNIGKMLEAKARIYVYPNRVGVRLSTAEGDRNGGLFLLDDDGSFDFKGTITNWQERESTNSEVTVTRNGQSYSAFSCTPDDSFEGRLTIPAVEEGNLKDIYVITVKAKNSNTQVFSSDTLILQVYDKDALKIVAEDEQGNVTDTLSGSGGRITLSNMGESAVREGKLDISTAEMEEILALKRQIDLKKYLHVNYEGIGWNTVADRMVWNSSNNDTATVNYRNGTLYDDIRNFEFTNYRPDEVMMLVGHDDGDTRITVTHGRTGNTMDFDVAVETLKDKLYLFQTYPGAACIITYQAYTDESHTKTQKRVSSTNEAGEYAVYEPYGIAGDVRFERTDADGSTWLGTIFYQNLLTQENDGSRLELYPLNSLEMREVTVQNFFLKDENGNPYSGPVRYSYGVYKNGEFCPQARLSDDKGSVEHARDKAEMTADADGLVSLHLDSTQFMTEEELQAGQTKAELIPDDRITFIVEMEFGEGYTQYQPKVAEIDANVNSEQAVRSADNVLNLIPAMDGRKAFVDSYRVQYKDEMKASYDATNNTGYVGLSNEFRDVDLKSRIIWWNARAEELDQSDLYGVSVTDESQNSLKGQKVSTQVYPFGYFPVTTNVFTITPELFDGKSVVDDEYSPIPVRVKLYDADGSLYAAYSAPFKLANLIGTSDITDFSQGLSIGSATGQLPSRIFVRDASLYADGRGGGGFSGQAFETGGFQGGEMANGALDGLSFGVPSFFPVKYNFVATDDPNVWKMIGVIEFSFGNDPDADASSSPSDKMKTNFGNAKNSLKDMGNDFKDAKKDLEKDWAGNFSGSVSIKGFVEGSATYDPKNDSWKNEFSGGGVVVSGSAGYVFNGNSVVGIVPITYSIGAGADLEVGLEFSPMSESKEEGGASIYTDFLSTVKFVAWAKAFAGIGFDFDIVAAKVGAFGQMNAGINVKTLNQAYRANDINTSYNYFNVGGEIGLKVELKLILFEYEKVLVSGKLEYCRMDKIDGRDDYTATVLPEKIYDSYDEDGAELEKLGIKKTEQNSALRNLSDVDLANMQVTAVRLKTESRGYLENPNGWSGENGIMPLSLDEQNAFEQIGYNIYPNAEPETARDGSIVVFRTDSGSTDLNQTAIGWARRNGDTYVREPSLVSGTIDNEKGLQVITPCTNLDYDGTEGFGVAAWEQQNEISTMAADSTATFDSVSDLMNRTELMVSVMENGAWGTPLRLTKNSVPDMAPEVAVNNGRAMVAWRQPASSNEANPTTFDVSDEIVYVYYDGVQWSEVRQLDLGDLGSIKGFDIAMAEDGTGIVVSAVQTAGVSDAMSMEGGANPETNGTNEITYTMVGADGKVQGDRVRLTNDSAADENPQAAYADGSFLLAWYSSEETNVLNPATGQYENKSVNDIKLRSIGVDGSIDSGFVNSISAINKSRPMEVGANFTMAQGADNSLGSIALIWKTAEKSASSETSKTPVYDRDIVHAVKFLKTDSGLVQVTAPQELADMGDASTADHISAYVNSSTIKAVIMKSDITGETKTYQPDIADGAEHATNPPVTLPVTMSSMVSATAQLKDSIQISDVTIDKEDIRTNAMLPVQFTVLNTGLTAITSLTAQIGPNEVSAEGLNILPNQVQTVHAQLSIGDVVSDTGYLVAAAFESGENASVSGELKLEFPDVSIGTIKVLDEVRGTRALRISLYNDSYLPLKDSGYAVELNLYDNHISKAEKLGISCVITDPAQLALIDRKGYTRDVVYTIPEDKLENGEIPENGINLYIKAKLIDQATGEEVEEKGYLYNDTSLKFETLYKDGIQFKPDAVLDNSGEVSRATVTVKNLSLKHAEELGNVLVSLLDQKGNVMETVSLATSSGSLFDLEGEDSQDRTVTFSKKGDSVTTKYIKVPDGTDYDNLLYVLEAGGRTFTQEELSASDTPDTALSTDTVNLSGTMFTAAAKSPNAEIILLDEEKQILAQGTGMLVYALPLTYGPDGETTVNNVTISVKPAAEHAEIKNYELAINNRREVSGNLLIESSNQTATGWTNSEEVAVSLSAQGLKDFVPVIWQYSIDGGEWTDADAAAQAQTHNLTVLREEGEHSIQARILDAGNFAMASDRLSVKIDRVKPVIEEESLTFIETDEKLLPAEKGVVGFLRNAFSLDTDGNTDKQLKVQVKATDALSGVYSVLIRAGSHEYRMEKLEGTDVYEGIVTHAFRGGLEIEAKDLAFNESTLNTTDLVIEELTQPALGTVAVTPNAQDVVIESGFTGNDIAEYSMQYREKGTEEWLPAVPEEGSSADKFIYWVKDLKPNTEYEYRIGQRLITKNEMTWIQQEDFATMVRIQTPARAGDCENCTVSADKTQAWPGETVTYTLSACDEHTARSLKVNGSDYAMENQEKKVLTYVYTVLQEDHTVTAEGSFAEKQISHVKQVMDVTMYANDGRNKTADTLKEYLDSLTDIVIVYDNGTVKNDYQRSWTLSEEQEWNERGDSYSYETAITLMGIETKAVRSVTVKPVSASIIASENIVKTVSENGYSQSQIGLPQTVEVTYDAETDPEDRVCAVEWTGWKDGKDGKEEGDILMTGTVSLPVWASGDDQTGLTVMVTNKTVVRLTNVQVLDRTYDGGTEANYLIDGSALEAEVVEGSYHHPFKLEDHKAVGVPVIHFKDKNAGTEKSVDVSGVSIEGEFAEYFRLDYSNLRADVTPKDITVTGLEAVNRIYDFTDFVELKGGTVNGILENETEIVKVTTPEIGRMDNADIGKGKKVSAEVIFDERTEPIDRANYLIHQPDYITVDIKELTVGVPTGLEWFDWGDSRIRWDSTDYAYGYEVQLYANGSRFGDPVFAEENEYDCKDILGGQGYYSFTVQALGQGNFADGGISAISQPGYVMRDTGDPGKFYIEVTSGEHGSVTPGSGMYAGEEEHTFTFKPDNGYSVDRVYVNGVETAFDKDHITLYADESFRIEVLFKKGAASPPTGDPNSLVWPVIFLTGGAVILFLGYRSIPKRKKRREK